MSCDRTLTVLFVLKHAMQVESGTVKEQRQKGKKNKGGRMKEK
jgi:hypothetical protein